MTKSQEDMPSSLHTKQEMIINCFSTIKCLIIEAHGDEWEDIFKPLVFVIYYYE